MSLLGLNSKIFIGSGSFFEISSSSGLGYRICRITSSDQLVPEHIHITKSYRLPIVRYSISYQLCLLNDANNESSQN